MRYRGGDEGGFLKLSEMRIAFLKGPDVSVLFISHFMFSCPAGAGGRAVSSSSYWQHNLNLSFLNEKLDIVFGIQFYC